MKAYLLQRKNAKSYYCMLYWNENGRIFKKQVSTGIPIKGNNKRKAEEKMEEIRREYEEKYENNRINSTNITFDQFFLEWIDSRVNYVQETTLYGYRCIANKHIIPYFKPLNIDIASLTPRDIQKYYDTKLKEGLSPNTVHRHHSNIRKALQLAVKLDLVPYNVADRTDLPKFEKYVPKVYDEDQLKTLLQVLNGHFLEIPITICAYLGLRRSEVFGLKWDDIDFEKRCIYITHAIVTTHGEVYKETLKTQSSRRTMAMSDNLYEFLLRIKKKQEENEAFFGNEYIKSDFVCVYENGKRMNVNYASKALRKIIKKNNLPYITFHGTRHSVATILIENDMNLKIVSEYLGHSTIKVTADYYAHPSMRSKIKAANSLDGLLNL